MERFGRRVIGRGVGLIWMLALWGLWLGQGQAQITGDLARLLPAQPPENAPPFVPGVVLVRLAERVAGTNEVAQSLAVDAAALSPLDISGQAGLFRLTVPEGTEIAEAGRLSALPTILYADPDYLFFATETIPDDTFYERYQWNLRHIRANIGWDRTRGSESVVIAIVDTGVDLGHPDLAAKIVGGIDTVNDDFVAQDDQGHGTHVASIAAAISNNRMGIAGLDWNARIMPIKVLDSAGSGSSSNIAAGIVWAADQGADIINLSLAGTSPSGVIENALQYAYERGVLLIAAAGNAYESGNPTSYPAAYAHVIGVAAVDDNDGHASYSNSGDYVDVAAPGGDPTSANDTDRDHWIPGAYWRGAGFSYAWLSGTSQAAPHVAGLAGLLLALDSRLTPDQLTQIITSSALDVQTPGWDPFSGYGRIDVAAALAAAAPPQGAPGVGVDIQLAQSPSEPAGVVAVGQEITLTIHISNTGTSSLSLVPLQNIFDPAHMTFRRADPAPEKTTENTLQWKNLMAAGRLLPGLGLTATVTFLTQATTDYQIARQTQNVAVVVQAQDEFAQQSATQADAASIRIARSAVGVETAILAPALSDVGAGVDITFAIRVTNVGQVSLKQIPVYDFFQADTLHFVSANIHPPRVTITGSQGELFWPDITDHFGDLTPGQVVQFTATFRLMASRMTANQVQVGQVVDVNDDPVPPVRLGDSVEVIPVATAVYRLFVPTVGGQPGEQPCPLPGCPIPGLGYPNGMALHSGLNRLYISSRATSQLFVLDGRTLAPITAVATGAEPWDVVINQNTNRLYVSNFASRDVWVYDALSLALLAQIPVGGQPAVMDILPDLDTVAVAVRGLNGVAFIQGLSLQEIVGSGGVGPFGVAADPISQDFILINRDAGTGRVLYREGGGWQAKGAEITFGEDGDRLVPFEAEFNPANRKLYVIYMQANGLWYVDIFHKESSQEVIKLATVRVGSGGSDRDPNVGGVGLAANGLTGHLFVTNTFDGTISVISGETNRLLATLPTGNDPFEVAVNPVTNQVFVSLRRDNRIHKFADTD